MFGIKKEKKRNGKSISLSVEGMHCTSCAMNIDGALEDLDGVISSKTHYAKQQTDVVYDPEQVNLDTIKEEIQTLDYTAKVLD